MVWRKKSNSFYFQKSLYQTKTVRVTFEMLKVIIFIYSEGESWGRK